MTVTIDNVNCALDQLLSTQIKCTTGPRIGAYLKASVLDIRVAGNGRVDNGLLNFRYVSLWSQTSTWGGQFAPVDGESVVVPQGLNLLVDIATTPMLNLVLVDGGSITVPSDADPNHQRSINAKNIMIKDGVFEAGTENEPYSSKLTITLHGRKYDPSIPIYGNKVFAGRFATIDIHGLDRQVSWTNLDTTAAAGSNSLILIREVDWQVGEKIMVTSTSFERDEAEYATIDSVSTIGGKTTFTLTAPLAFEHYAATQTYGSDSV